MFRFLHIAGLAALALVLPGCAEMHLTKLGADTAAVSRDLGDCRALALRSAGPAVAPASSTCMAKRGYALRQQ
jgi:hypothetical protein